MKNIFSKKGLSIFSALSVLTFLGCNGESASAKHDQQQAQVQEQAFAFSGLRDLRESADGSFQKAFEVRNSTSKFNFDGFVQDQQVGLPADLSIRQSQVGENIVLNISSPEKDLTGVIEVRKDKSVSKKITSGKNSFKEELRFHKKDGNEILYTKFIKENIVDKDFVQTSEFTKSYVETPNNGLIVCVTNGNFKRQGVGTNEYYEVASCEKPAVFNDGKLVQEGLVKVKSKDGKQEATIIIAGE